MSRTSIFLQEMGVGPRWLLRDRVTVESAAETDMAAMAVVEDAAVAVAAEAPTMQPAPAPQPATPPAPPIAAAPAAASDDTAWFDEAPAPPPRAPTLKQPAAPKAKAETPASGEDTSWFDAVPAAAPMQRAPVRTAATDEEIAAMDWPALQAAVRRCTRCALCETRRVAVPGHGDDNARWLVLGTAPTQADEDEEQPLSGAPGQLLHHMLRAVDVSTLGGAYVTTLVKCRPVADDGTERLPAAGELAACRPYLRRELELTGAGLALTLGGVTAKGLLGMAARGKVLHFDGPRGDLPVVATYHPADLLKKPEDKARAWADLCLARSAHAGRR